MSEMVERVARAIYEGRNGAGCKPWSRLPSGHKVPYLGDAEIAILTMREPDDAMLQAGEDAFVLRFAYVPANPWTAVSSIYSAILDAALIRTPATAP